MKKTNRILTAILSAMMILTVVCQPIGASAAASTKPVIKATQTVISAGTKTQVKAMSGNKNVTSKATFKSSNKKVAAVSKKGIVTGRKAGTSYITATYKGKTSKKVKITVAKVSLNKTSVKLTVGKTAALTAKYNGKKVKPAYKSNGTAIASVNKSGKITAKGAGTVTITATYKDTKAACKVTVTEAEVKHVTTEAVTKEPTCTESGIKTVTCSCGDTWAETIPATGHNWADEEVTYEESTETAVSENEVIYIFPKYATAECQDALRAEAAAHPDTDTIIEGASGYACNKCNKLWTKTEYGAEVLNLVATHCFEVCDSAGYWSPKVCCIKRVIPAQTKTVANTVTKTVTKCTVCGAVKEN